VKAGGGELEECRIKSSLCRRGVDVEVHQDVAVAFADNLESISLISFDRNLQTMPGILQSCYTVLKVRKKLLSLIVRQKIQLLFADGTCPKSGDENFVRNVDS
jgi:hypothetical protein